MHVRMRLPPAPPHLHRRRPVLCVPLPRTRQCSWGCHSRSSFISIIPSSSSAASSPSSKASISHKHPSTPKLHTATRAQIPSLQHPCVAQDSSQAVTPWDNLASCIPLFPSARLGLPLQQSPSPVLFIRSPKHRSAKSRQAVSSSCQSVCWLGSWSSTVPLEDDPVDEDRGDGSGGAAGETEDSHPKHRWVTTTHSTPAIVLTVFLIAEDACACLSETWT